MPLIIGGSFFPNIKKADSLDAKYIKKKKLTIFKI